jgi:alpha-glucosidase
MALAWLAAAATGASAQAGRFTFLGDYRGLERVKGGIVVRAANGAVRLEEVTGGAFRVRYSFNGAFDSVSSWATLPESLALVDPRLRETPESLVVAGRALVATVRKRPLRLAFSDTAGVEYFAESFGAGQQGARVTHIVARPADSHYFGLGEQAFSLDHTGEALTLWNTDAFGYHGGSTPLYSSIPFYIALRGGRAYGIFYDNSFRSEFDFGGRLKEHVGFSADGGELRFYVLPGPSLRSVLAGYTRLTGRTPLPPRWALGYQQSRWGYYPDSELVRLAYEFRSRGIPCDVLYLDIDYMDGYRVFTWDPGRFPDPRRLLADLGGQGFKVTTIVDPGVKVDSGYDVYRQGLEGNAFVTWPDGTPYIGTVWPGKVAFPDFSLQRTRTWWGDLHRRLLDPGVAGIWNDMNEPSNFGGGGTLPDATTFGRAERPGGSHLEFHNLYALLEARATYEGWRRIQPERRPFIVTRAGFSGIQRYSSIWTGDNTANWEHAGLAIPMVLGLGLSGVPFAGADVGGFAGSPDGELFSRFLEIAAFFPFFRTHSEFASARREPWAFGPVYEAANRELIRLRYRLLPHLYTAFFQHARDGGPVARPLVWDSQGDTAALRVNDEFTFGDHLLVAPVVRQGQDSRPVYLPDGRWYRFPSDERYDGGTTVTVAAPRVNPWRRDDTTFVTGVPLFVRAGAVIPMQDAMQYVGEKPVDAIELAVWDGGAETSELYEDDGESFAYAQGAYRLTRFRTAADSTTLAIQLTATGRYDGAASRFRVVVHGLAAAPRAVTIDGAPAEFRFDAQAKLLRFDARPGSAAIRIVR